MKAQTLKIKRKTPYARPNKSESDDVDPLDAFMVGIMQEVERVNKGDMKKLSDVSNIHVPNLKPKLGDNEYDEMDEINIDIIEPQPAAARKANRKHLALVDHSQIPYEPFRKRFYNPPPEGSEEMGEFGGIKIRGGTCPRPDTKWCHFGLPATCLDLIKSLHYTAPTLIQAQAIPAIMSGHDVIGVAKTGSGKTIAFLLPMLRHIKDQRPLARNEGPIAVVMTPTHELALQIHRECMPFLNVFGLRAVCANGGSPISDQIGKLKRGAEIVICTPGRMIELLTASSCQVTNLRRVTYVVIDEADRMFDKGFEPQVMEIISNIRPDRQTILFSATFPKQVSSLAKKILCDPLEITVNGCSVVPPEITQTVEVLKENTKFDRLLHILGKAYNEDNNCRTLIFVDHQGAADNLLFRLTWKGYLCRSLHGGRDQVDRKSAICEFKAGVVPIVIATSVAARGLDVKQLKLVINYDAPNHMEDYVHRAGRTGRAGNTGTCVTFITPEQERYSVGILRAMKASNATIPRDLEDLANGFQKKCKNGEAQAVGNGFGGKGLGRLEKERDARVDIEHNKGDNFY